MLSPVQMDILIVSHAFYPNANYCTLTGNIIDPTNLFGAESSSMIRSANNILAVTCHHLWVDQLRIIVILSVGS